MNGIRVIELSSVDSTNDHAKALARQGAAAGTVVFAHEQRAGRGRQGNRWVSAPGNLFMSVILRPRVAAQNVGQLSFLAGLALANVLSALISADICLKWPNDVLVNQKKIAGILIETEGAGGGWAVVGIGLNIVSAPENAIALRDARAGEKTPREMLDLIAFEISRLMTQWESQGFADIRAGWMKRAWRLEGSLTARLPKGAVTGLFKGINDDGALQLQLPDGKVELIASGEVFA